MSSINLTLRNRRRQRRGVLSAGSTTILLGLLLLLTSCGQLETGVSSPATSTIAGDLIDVQMIDTHIGWAVSSDDYGDGTNHILKTVDGGIEWQTVLQCLPAEGHGVTIPCAVDFHSALVAAVVQSEWDDQTSSSQLRIFHTSDGGATWQDIAHSVV